MMYGYGHGHGMSARGWFAMASGTVLEIEETEYRSRLAVLRAGSG